MAVLGALLSAVAAEVVAFVCALLADLLATALAYLTPWFVRYWREVLRDLSRGRSGRTAGGGPATEAGCFDTGCERVVVSRTRLAPRIRRAGLIIGLTLLVGAVAAAVVFPTQIVGWMLSRGLARTDIAIRYDTLDASILGGRAALTGVHLERQVSDRSTFALDADSVNVDIALLPLLIGQVRFERIEIAGLAGRYAIVGDVPGRPTRQTFQIRDLHVRDVHVAFVDSTCEPEALALDVQVTDLRTTPYRSRLALFDVLFNTRAAGRINGAPFELGSETDGPARRSYWRVESLPASSLACYVGHPMDWMSSGAITGSVEHTRLPDGAGPIAAHGSLVLEGTKARVPDEVRGVLRPLAEAIAKYINDRDGDIPLEFAFGFDTESFEGRLSDSNQDFWRQMGEPSLRALLELAHVDPGLLTQRQHQALDSIKQVLKRNRGG